MRFISETSETKQPVLIVDPYETRTGLQIERGLSAKDDIEVLVQSEFPVRLEHFFQVYVVNADYADATRRQIGKNANIILVYVKQPKKARTVAAQVSRDRHTHIKVISVSEDYLDEAAFERLLWFSFSSNTPDPLLEIVTHSKAGASDPLAERNIRVKRRFKRHYMLGAILTIAVYGFITLLILLASSFIYISTFETSEKPGIILNAQTARGLNSVGRALYRPLRPMFFFFSVGLLPDTLVDMNSQLDSLAQTHEQITDTATRIARTVFIKQKNKPLKQMLSKQIDDLQSEMAKAIELSSVLEQKIPHWNDRTETVRLAVSSRKDTLIKLQPILPLLKTILARDSRGKYLILLADTNSAKPGGGLLPFFGILTISDMDILSFDLYDSRAVDQARTEPIQVPTSFRALSGEAVFTLQNSLLSGDFKENYRQITDLLAREANMRDFDGALLLTDGGIEQLISAYTPLYVPEIKETLTPENYLIKYQIAADKKIFMTALINEFQMRAAQTPSTQLVPAIVEAFNEKQIIFLSQDASTARVFDGLYWSGIVPTPHCLIQSFVCTADYIFPLQSNIGEKPVNRFVEKSMAQQVRVDSSGHISNTFTMRVRNTSLSEVFPGGSYNSYAQVILPATANIRRVTVNGTVVEQPDISTSTYRIVGFPFEVAAQTSKEVKIEYDLQELIPKTKSIYQLIFQKQIGSPNSDISLEIQLPPHATITNKNFSPVVKNGLVSYNTVLNADKLFVLEIDNSHQ
ncbi:DUF4012 domain-containing protein [Candidatus Microgenomates bacterium]|nr:DUF4012 domain-containing protein [Candidatus Microgenomates bacterium]